MSKILDKSKIYNYIVAGLFLFVSVMFIKNVASFIWNFDIFNKHQLFTFVKRIFRGKAFKSLKQLSFLITFVGFTCVVVSGVMIAMKLKFKKEVEEEKPESASNIEGETETSDTPVVEKVEEKVEENALEKAFSMYDAKPVQDQILPEKVEENPVKKTEEMPFEKEEVNFEDDGEERLKLQNKIKEIMQKMKEKQEFEIAENPAEKQEVVDVPAVEKSEISEAVEIPSKPSKILEKKSFLSVKNEKSELNFKNISEEKNMKMEHKLISAGFKLLSEIRIGSTGIDYLGVAKDKLVVVQLDTSEGNWFASEDKIEDGKAPVWFSEAGNKISPVARAIEAKNDIEQLLKDEINLPVEAVACLASSDVVNADEWKEKWKDMGVSVVKLDESEDDDENDFGEIDSLTQLYPVRSQEEIAEEDMNKIIAILEKAEIPE